MELKRNNIIGYIVVIFNMEKFRAGQMDKPHLPYIHAPLMDQWQQMKGFRHGAGLTDLQGRNFALLDGGVVFYHPDQSSQDGFQSMVTH